MTEPDSRRMWPAVSRKLGWSTSGPPTSLMAGPVLTSKQDNIANIQNDYYIDKVQNIIKNLPPPTQDPLTILRQAIKKWKTPPKELFNLRPITDEETKKYIMSLSNSTSCGVDGIPSSILKLGVDILTPVIKHACNKQHFLRIMYHINARKWTR